MESFSLEQMGERLRLIRAGKGYGGDRQMRAFCREYKLNPSVWGALERGTKPQLYVTTLARICEQFDVNPTYILFGRGRTHLSEISPIMTRQEFIEEAAAVIGTMTREEENEFKQDLYKLAKGKIVNETQPTPPHVQESAKRNSSEGSRKRLSTTIPRLDKDDRKQTPRKR